MATSACAAFFARGQQVALQALPSPPAPTCQIDAENAFFGATTQAVWSILSTVQPDSTVRTHITRARHSVVHHALLRLTLPVCVLSPLPSAGLTSPA